MFEIKQQISSAIAISFDYWKKKKKKSTRQFVSLEISSGFPTCSTAEAESAKERMKNNHILPFFGQALWKKSIRSKNITKHQGQPHCAHFWRQLSLSGVCLEPSAYIRQVSAREWKELLSKVLLRPASANLVIVSVLQYLNTLASLAITTDHISNWSVKCIWC